MRRLLVAVPCLLVVVCAFAQAPVLRNPGFESVANGALADWSCPNYWSGELRPVEDPALVRTGKRAAQLTAVAQGGRTWGRVLNTIMAAQIGLDYRFTVFARGTGSLKLGVINYLPPVKDEMKYEYQWQQPAVALTDQWQQITWTFTPVNYTVERLAPVIEIEGEQAVAVLDDVDLQIVHQADGRLELPTYSMMRVGAGPDSRAETTITGMVTQDGKPAAMPVLVVQHRAAGTQAQELNTGLDGLVKITIKAPDDPELIRVDLVQRDLGQTATYYCDVVPRAMYDSFMKLAETTKIQPHQHWLFLGDSLTDFSRGFNYVDQVMYWLRYHPGQMTFRNAGVGGDYITRSLDRLNGKAGTHRLEMYDGMFDPKPTHVFMMLGHNDSKLTSSSNFAEPVVKPEDYKAQFAEFIAKVKEKTGGAPFTLLSPTSSVYEITKANADKAVAAGRGASLFGKPEVMARYTQLTQEVAAATGCDFIDVFTPTRDFPNKPTLFTADGVHLSLEGNHVLALVILKHLVQ